jgi:hypothetical protein
MLGLELLSRRLGISASSVRRYKAVTRTTLDDDGTVLAVFGFPPGFVGWVAAFAARPRSDLLSRIRYLIVDQGWTPIPRSEHCPLFCSGCRLLESIGCGN